MLLKRAMRYYRLWIYVCNVALLVSVAGFACVAGRIMLDPRRALVPATRSWFQPSFLYAYLALAAQGGALQLLGCVGALRLSERLLGAYWILLLLLLCGDAIVGMAWAFRFDQVIAEVRPGLQKRLAEEYSSDPSFTSTWDELQREARCCGVAGPRDFLALVPSSSSPNVSNSHGGGGTTPANGGPWWWWRRDGEDLVVVPESCCRLPSSSSSHSSSPSSTVSRGGRNESLNDSSSMLRCEVFTKGCEENILNWLRSSADTLFVLGYCVVAFIKLSFLGILRYEIREMIQKIKLMQSERDALANNVDLTMLTTHGSPSVSGTTPLHMNHLGPPDRAPLLQRCSECNPPPVMCSPPVITKLANHTGITGGPGGGTGGGGGGLHPHHLHPHLGNGPTANLLTSNDGNDSDTNSHCALIVLDKPGSNGNNNELHELQEMRLMARQTQI